MDDAWSKSFSAWAWAWNSARRTSADPIGCRVRTRADSVGPGVRVEMPSQGCCAGRSRTGAGPLGSGLRLGVGYAPLESGTLCFVTDLARMESGRSGDNPAEHGGGTRNLKPEPLQQPSAPFMGRTRASVRGDSMDAAEGLGRSQHQQGISELVRRDPMGVGDIRRAGSGAAREV